MNQEDIPEVDQEVASSQLTDLGSLVASTIPPGFITHIDLERHEREAADLHAQATELRARLDEPPAAITTHPQHKTNLGRPVAGVLVAIALTGAILAGTHPWSSGDGNTPSRPVTAAPAKAPVKAPAKASAKPAAKPVPLADVPVPGGLGLPTAGRGIDAEGTALGIRVPGATGRNLGTLLVAQRIVLAPQGVQDVNLSQSTTPDLDGDAAQLNPTVTGLKVQVNGEAATVQKDGDGWTIRAADGQRARVVLLQYRLVDAVARSTPSASGRALGLIPPLTIAGNAPSSVLARSASSQVIGMVCPGAPAEKMLCGRSGSGGWQAEVPSDAASQSILIQLDLNS